LIPSATGHTSVLRCPTLSHTVQQVKYAITLEIRSKIVDRYEKHSLGLYYSMTSEKQTYRNKIFHEALS